MNARAVLPVLVTVGLCFGIGYGLGNRKEEGVLPEREEVREEAVSALARRSSGAAVIREAAGDGSGTLLDRYRGMLTAVGTMDGGDFAGAYRALLGEPGCEAMALRVLKRWGEEDLEGLVQAMSDGLVVRSAVVVAFRGCMVSGHADQVWDWLQRGAPGERRDGLIRRFLDVEINHDPESMLERLRSMPASRRQDLACAYWMPLATDHPELASTVFDSIPSPAAELLGGFAPLAEHDPELALALSERVGGGLWVLRDAKSEAVTGWARSDPDGALSYAKRATGNDRDALLSGVAAGMVDNDLARAASVTLEIRSPKWRKAAAETVTWKLEQLEDGAGRAWAEEHLRGAVLEAALHSLSDDPFGLN